MTRQAQTEALSKMDRKTLLSFTRRLGLNAHKLTTNEQLVNLIVRSTDSLHGRQ